MDSRVTVPTSRVGAFRRRIAMVFALQFATVVLACVLGIYNVIPAHLVIAVVLIITSLAWFITRREWRPIRALARVVSRWDGQSPDPGLLKVEQLSARTDADVASLTRALHGFAVRLTSYNQRERNFTRDASHELRSPLTVIKMSIDMLAEEEELSEFGERSVRRIKRATRELEVLVEALLVLAREAGNPEDERHFVVNDIVREELDAARGMLSGRPIELLLEESARFAQQGSPQALSVLCWQLIRNAFQQTEEGSVLVSVLPGMISVRNHGLAPGEGEPARSLCAEGVDRHGFELAIAQRICDRFDWSLELQTLDGSDNVANVRFPHPLPAEERPAVDAP